MKRVSIIIPCFNEELNIRPLFSALCKYEQAQYSYEYIFVDDGSVDNTWGELAKLQSNSKRSIVKLQFVANYGHQAALHAGLSEATGDVHISMDADMQHPPSKLPAFLKAYEAGNNLVVAQRETAKLPILKKVSSTLFYFIYNILSPTKSIPNVADFRLTSAKITTMLLSYSEQNTTFRYILGHAGLVPYVITYKQPERLNGVSEYTFGRMIVLARDAILQNSALPLQLTLLFGLGLTIFSTIGFTITAYFRYIVHSAIFSTVPLFGFFTLANNGIIILIIGIMGLYIANIQTQSLNRPMYHIKNIKK